MVQSQSQILCNLTSYVYRSPVSDYKNENKDCRIKTEGTKVIWLLRTAYAIKWLGVRFLRFRPESLKRALQASEDGI